MATQDSPNQNPDIPPFNNPPPPLTAEEILKNAQSAMATVTSLVEAAKAAVVTVNTASESIKASEKTVAEGVAAAQAKLAEITTTATQVVAAKTKISDEQAVIATKSDHIQKAQDHADGVRANLDRALTAATQQATNAEAQQAKAQSAADAATKELAAIQTTKGTVESEATTAAAARKTAVESANITKDLADKAATIEERIAAYEKKHAEFEKLCAEHLNTIETLLRGATSAGLAHAFDERRQTFLKPQQGWQKVFVGSLAAIVVLTITGLIQVYMTDKVPTYDELVRLWLVRLPIAGALVWLAMHASRESALAKRLEEDYGYKSAIATCFEGFRKQMAEISKDATVASPLAKLCGDTLTTIATPPGRIYDKHKLTVSPTSELTEAAKVVATATGVAKP